MLRPSATFGRMRPEGSVRGSLLFALLSSFAGYAPIGLANVLLATVHTLDSPPTALDEPLLLGMYGFSFAVYGVLVPAMGLVTTLFVSMGDHLVLKGLGVPSSFRATLRGHALSQGVHLVGLVPCLGVPVFVLWCMGVRVVAYRALYRLGWGTAAMGALLFPFLAGGLGVWGWRAWVESWSGLGDWSWLLDG
ncbi:hypothetical protein WA016_03933 [Myxococcus stipitatus]